jgi:hypothetical protein
MKQERHQGLKLRHKPCYRPSEGNVPLFSAVVRFPSVTRSDRTWQSSLGTCYESSIGRCWTIPRTVWILHPAIFNYFRLEAALVRTSFHLRLKHRTCHHHMADARGTYVLRAWDGQTSPHTATGAKPSKKPFKCVVAVTTSLCVVSFLC